VREKNGLSLCHILIKPMNAKHVTLPRIFIPKDESYTNEGLGYHIYALACSLKDYA
jgi:hypothetical protein